MKLLTTASLILAGCTIAIPAQMANYQMKPVTAVELATKIYDALDKHNYTVLKAKVDSKKAVIILADIGSKKLQEQNYAFLKDAVREQDIVFAEGLHNEQQEKDLQQKLFEELNFPKELQDKIIRQAEQQEQKTLPELPCKIKSADDDVLVYLLKEAFLGTLDGLQYIPSDKQPTFDEIFEKTQHYRNIAIKRTYKKEQKEDTTLFQIISDYEVITQEDMEKQNEGYPFPTNLPMQSPLCTVLKEANIQYMVIAPKNLIKEYQELLEPPK
ncbi:hypothetical protein HY484_03730 [Candidatus Woesearchaeota archaeon]|nr:hypothetical protein [Candidatus Woesearchaeota archaeon]